MRRTCNDRSLPARRLAEAARRGDANAVAENSGCITALPARDHLVRSDLTIAHLPRLGQAG
jgi:hypothetical protein